MIKSTFKQLQVFLAVVEESSFGRAADRLDVSQPAVSRHVAALEQSTGPLFIRRRGARVTLSPAGKKLYERLPSLLAEMRELGLASKVSEQKNDSIRIGAGRFLVEAIQSAIPDFSAENPLVSIDVETVITEEDGLRALARDELDLLYLTRQGAHLPAGCELIRTVEAGLYAKPGKIKRSDKVVSMIMPNADSPEEIFLRNLLEELGVRFQISARAQHVMTAKNMAIRGVGCCFIFNEVVEDDVKRGDLEKLPAGQATLYRCCYRNPVACDGPHILALMDYLASRL